LQNDKFPYVLINQRYDRYIKNRIASTGETEKKRWRLVHDKGRRLTFKVEAYDERKKIGEGTHVRGIINLTRFMARVASKAKS